MKINIQQALDMAKSDPNSEFASKLRKTIESGSIDEVAGKQGVDLTPFGRPKYQESQSWNFNPGSRLVEQVKDIPQDIQKTGQNIAGTFSAGKERISDAMAKGITGEQGLGSATFQAVGEGLRTGANIIGDLFIGGASLITTPAEEQLFQDKLVQGVQSLGKTDVGQGVAELAEQYNTFKEANPTVAANLEASLGFAEAILEVTGAGEGLKAVKKGLEPVGDIVESGIKQAKSAVTDIKAPTVPKFNKSVKNAEDIVGQITQGKKKNFDKQLEALRSIDTDEVKTYQDLLDVTGAKKTVLAKSVDDALDLDTGLFKADELALVKKGKTGNLVSKPVDESIEHLSELYRTIGDDVALDNITAIKNKLDVEGLSRKEINDLAREYGQEFSKKAFRLDGTPTTSVVGQRFENTRTKLKEVARQGLQGDAAKALDKEYSNLLTLENDIRKVDTSVQNLKNKTIDRGVIENLSNKGAKLFNVLTAGGARGFLSGLLQSNVGSKTMNSLAIQDALAKNLKALKKLDTIDTIVDVKKQAKVINEVAETISKEKGFSIIDDTFLDTDKIVKDIGKRIKNTPNKQGGFVKVGLDKADDLGLKQYDDTLLKQIDDNLVSNPKTEGRAVILDSDEIKKMHPDYDPKNPAELHAESSKINQKLFEKELASGEHDDVIFLAGGAGSGKSEAVVKHIANTPGLVLDGTLKNFKKASANIQKVLDSGKTPTIKAVYGRPELAYYFNMVRGREVPVNILTDTHIGFRNTISDLHKKFGDDIIIDVVDNTNFLNKARPITNKTDSINKIKNEASISKTFEKAIDDIHKFRQKNGDLEVKKLILDIIRD